MRSNLDFKLRPLALTIKLDFFHLIYSFHNTKGSEGQKRFHVALTHIIVSHVVLISSSVFSPPHQLCARINCVLIHSNDNTKKENLLKWEYSLWLNIPLKYKSHIKCPSGISHRNVKLWSLPQGLSFTRHAHRPCFFNWIKEHSVWHLCCCYLVGVQDY